MRVLLTRLLRIVHAVEDLILVGLLLAMVGVAVMQIVLRNGFDGGFLWAETFLRVLVLWIGLAGAMAASRQHRHISIDLIGRFLPPAAHKVAIVFTALFTAGVCALLAYYSYDFVRIEYENPSIAFGVVPTWACESIMPIAFTVIGLRYLLLAATAPFSAHPHGDSLVATPEDAA